MWEKGVQIVWKLRMMTQTVLLGLVSDVSLFWSRKMLCRKSIKIINRYLYVVKTFDGEWSRIFFTVSKIDVKSMSAELTLPYRK